MTNKRFEIKELSNIEIERLAEIIEQIEVLKEESRQIYGGVQVNIC